MGRVERIIIWIACMVLVIGVGGGAYQWGHSKWGTKKSTAPKIEMPVKVSKPFTKMNKQELLTVSRNLYDNVDQLLLAKNETKFRQVYDDCFEGTANYQSIKRGNYRPNWYKAVHTTKTNEKITVVNADLLKYQLNYDTVITNKAQGKKFDFEQGRTTLYLSRAENGTVKILTVN